MTPRLFLDSADRAAHARWLATGLFHGVTTNPTLLRRAGLRCEMGTIRRLALDAFDHGAREVQAQGWGGTADLLRHTGEAIAALDPRMVVKLPATEAGFTAARRLIADGARVTITAAYAPHHALAAGALSASYVAPYFGRMGDAGLDAGTTVRTMLAGAGGETRVLVASIRAAKDLSTLLDLGCDTFTVGPGVAEAMVADPRTLEASAAFEAHARGEAEAGGERG